MFKLYHINYHNELEVFPVDGIYIVYELYEYRFNFTGDIGNAKVFIEDVLLDYDNTLLAYTSDGVNSRMQKRIFEDYFGYLTININNNEFKFEVRIQKLKVPELEDILLYIWNNNPVVFDNFLSKSTLKSKLIKDSRKNFDFSSKFVNVFDDFFMFFKKKYLMFKSLPHSVLRTKSQIIDYDEANISNSSIDWLLNNLDELDISPEFKYLPNSIEIEGSYGIIEKIFTEKKKANHNVYENQIILGAFDHVLLEINKIKEMIKGYVSVEQYYEKDFFSIDEFKIIPFLKIKNDLSNIEFKIKSLKNKYQKVFEGAVSNNCSPRLTPVFSNKRHYTEAYNKIRLIRNINIDIDGELNLINIKKISTLYEKYNLYVLLNLLWEKVPFNLHSDIYSDMDKREFHFQYNSYSISLYYDKEISSKFNKTGLQRISEGRSYKPDYLLKLEKKSGEVKYFILDSKYSSYKRLKSSHLDDCVKKYILDIGISNSPTLKVNSLILLYPGDIEEVIYGSDIFSPKVSIMPSKVQTDNLNIFINCITSFAERSP
jgi:hypothetical protein